MLHGTGRLWKAAAALLLALVVSLGTLAVAQASHPTPNPKVGWYQVGGSAADRMLSKDGGVIATWTHVKLKKDYSWRAYWTVKNTSSSPQKVGCAGYQHYGLKGYKAKNYYHATFNFEGKVKDAKCVHLGGAYRQMLQPRQTITSWAAFKYAGKKGTCTKLTLPTGPKVPEHVGYTKCVDPYARYLEPGPIGSTVQFEFPWDSSNPLAYTGGPHQWVRDSNKWSGLDFSDGSESTHILAMADGTVTYVGWEDCVDGPKTCRAVKVSHDNGWEVWYVHLSSFAPNIETQCQPKPSYCFAPVPVKQGEWLGNEGSTGAGKTIHIHIELRKGPKSEPHEWSEVSGGIEGWTFHRTCDGYEKYKPAYDEKKQMSQADQKCIAYPTNGINDGYQYDGYMSKGDIAAIPWVGSGVQYWVHSTNHEL